MIFAVREKEVGEKDFFRLFIVQKLYYIAQGMAEVLPQSATPAEIRAEIATLWNSQLNREGHTFAQLKRAGTDTCMDAFEQYGANVPKNLLLPIPISAIEANPNLIQNTGW